MHISSTKHSLMKRKIIIFVLVSVISFICGSLFVAPSYKKFLYFSGFQQAHPVTVEPAPKFTYKYPDINDFLEAKGYGEYEVIFDATQENCGIRFHEQEVVRIAGCYSTKFGKHTILMYWNEEEFFPDELLEFVVLHEIAHSEQFMKHYDIMTHSFLDRSKYELMHEYTEVDASCRAVHNNNLRASVSFSSSAPCYIEDWTEGWIVEQFEKILAGKIVDISALEEENNFTSVKE